MDIQVTMIEKTFVSWHQYHTIRFGDIVRIHLLRICPGLMLWCCRWLQSVRRRELFDINICIFSICISRPCQAANTWQYDEFESYRVSLWKIVPPKIQWGMRAGVWRPLWSWVCHPYLGHDVGRLWSLLLWAPSYYTYRTFSLNFICSSMLGICSVVK